MEKVLHYCLNSLSGNLTPQLRKYKQFLTLIKNNQTKKLKTFVENSGTLKRHYIDLLREFRNMQTEGKFINFEQSTFFKQFMTTLKKIKFRLKKRFEPSKTLQNMANKMKNLVLPMQQMTATGKKLPIQLLSEMYVKCLQSVPCREEIEYDDMKQLGFNMYITQKLGDKSFLKGMIPLIYPELTDKEEKDLIDKIYSEKQVDFWDLKDEQNRFVFDLAQTLSPMMSIDITKTLKDEMVFLNHYQNDVIDLYISDNVSDEQFKTILLYLNYVYFGYKRLFDVKNNKLKIILALTGESKEFKMVGEREIMTFKEDDVNSGATQQVIYIFRKEEILKLILHESLHYYSLDIFNGSKSFNEMFSYQNADWNDANFMESIVETLTVVLKSIIYAKEIFPERYMEKITELIQYERDFSLFQTAKIMTLAKFDSYDNFIDLEKKKKIYIETAVVGYHIYKAALLRNLEEFLQIYFMKTMTIEHKRDYAEFKDMKIKEFKQNMKSLSDKGLSYEGYQDEVDKITRKNDELIRQEKINLIRKSKEKLIEKILNRELRVDPQFKREVDDIIEYIKENYDGNLLLYKTARMTLIENPLDNKKNL